MRRVQLTDDPMPGPGRSLVLDLDEERAIRRLRTDWQMATTVVPLRLRRTLRQRLAAQGLIETDEALGWRLTSLGARVQRALTTCS